MTPTEFIEAALAFFRRQILFLLFFPLLGAAIAALYLTTATPKFTAEAVLLTELKKTDGSGPSNMADVGAAASMMDNQVEILKSEKIALSIINTLQLTKDPEFADPRIGFLGKALGLFTLLSTPEPTTEYSLVRRALERFYRKLTVKRVGLSYSISIQFESSNPERAAQIANAIAEAYTVDQMYANYEAARQATEWLQGRVTVLRSKAFDAQKAVGDYKATHAATNQDQSELRELEISAQTYRRLYDSFVQRSLESAEQETSPVSQGRLMTVASPPLTPSSPKTLLVLALSIGGGTIVGIVAALLRDVSDLTFRTRERVLSVLHTDCIGVIPAAMTDDSIKKPTNPRPVPVRARSRTIVCSDPVLRGVIDGPRSAFCESLRSIKLAIDTANRGSKRTQIIGIASASPNEGRSTVAASLAQLLAQGGCRTILVDCDLRNPSLSSSLASGASLGILDVTSGRTNLDDATWVDPDTEMHFLPAADSSRLAYTSEALGSADMADLFRTLRESYQYVIVDLSPIAPFVDTRAAAHLIDSFVLVIKWGHTKLDIVRSALDTGSDVHSRLMGVILNKANVSALKRYGDAFDSCKQQYPEPKVARDE